MSRPRGRRDITREQLDRMTPSDWRRGGKGGRRNEMRNDVELSRRLSETANTRAISMREESQRTQQEFGTPQNVSMLGGLQQDEARKQARRRRGRASTILTSPRGTSSGPAMLGYNVLLGG